MNVHASQIWQIPPVLGPPKFPNPTVTKMTGYLTGHVLPKDSTSSQDTQMRDEACTKEFEILLNAVPVNLCIADSPSSKAQIHNVMSYLVKNMFSYVHNSWLWTKNLILLTEFSKTTTKTTCDMVKGGREVI